MKGEKKSYEKKGVDLSSLHKTTHQKIDYVSSKARINEIEVYNTSKEFFKNLLELDYEFTHEELIEELKKTYLDTKSYEKISTFINTLGQLEYTKKQFTQQELKTILEEMRIILNHLIHKHKTKTRWEKLLIKLKLIPGTNDYEQTELLKLRKEVIEEEKDIDIEEQLITLRNLLEQIKKEKKAEEAKKVYQEANKLYSKLPEDEQKKMYPEISETYNLILKKN